MQLPFKKLAFNPLASSRGRRQITRAGAVILLLVILAAIALALRWAD